MGRTTKFRILIATILVAATGTAADGESQIIHRYSNPGAIFEVRIETVQLGVGCENTNNRFGLGAPCHDVRARVLRILKSDDDHRITVSAVEAKILTTRLGKAGAWDRAGLRQGVRYLVFSEIKGGPAALFASPSAVYELSGDDNAVADVELLVNCATQPLPQQAASLALAIGATTRPHSLYLAQHASSLLLIGTDSETAELMRSIERARVSAFTTLAYHLFLSSLAPLHSEPPENALRVFLTVTIRSLTDEPQPSDPSDTLLSAPTILRMYGPSILASQKTLGLLKSGLDRDLVVRFQGKAAGLIASPRITQEERILLQQLLRATQTQ